MLIYISSYVTMRLHILPYLFARLVCFLYAMFQGERLAHTINMCLTSSKRGRMKIIFLIALVYVLMMSKMGRLFDDDIAYLFSLCFYDVLVC